jgi:nitrile hydratase accessory protein
VTANPETVRAAAANLAGASPPMSAGEPVFAAPWEGRAFGLALDLVEQRGLPWSMFRELLIAAIAEEPGRPYYESWVVALERLVAEQELVTLADLTHERAHVAAYRYDEGDTDIEVVPLANDRAVLAQVLDIDPAAHVELYRVWSGDVAVAWGVRSFDAGGAALGARELRMDEWSTLRDRLLSFQTPAPWLE